MRIMYFHTKIQYICIVYVLFCQLNYRITYIPERMCILTAWCGTGKKSVILTDGKDVPPFGELIFENIFTSECTSFLHDVILLLLTPHYTGRVYQLTKNIYHYKIKLAEL